MRYSSKLAGSAAIFAIAALSGCVGSGTTDASLPTGSEAYAAIDPPAASTAAQTNYLIAPTDILTLRVFQEPELSVDKLRVDEAGFIQVPLVGQIKASDRTVQDVNAEVTERLRRSYLRDPRVNLAVVEAAKRFVSVEGEVKRPGVYEIDNNFTLLSAVARAESPTATAKLNEVIVFRTVDGRRMAGRFNLNDIRGGAAPDPQIRDGDVVMVGFSKSKGLWQDFLKAAPVLNSFVYLASNN